MKKTAITLTLLLVALATAFLVGYGAYMFSVICAYLWVPRSARLAARAALAAEA